MMSDRVHVIVPLETTQEILYIAFLEFRVSRHRGLIETSITITRHGEFNR